MHSHCAFLGVETKSCTLDKADGDDLLTGCPTWISSCNPCYHVIMLGNYDNFPMRWMRWVMEVFGARLVVEPSKWVYCCSMM